MELGRGDFCKISGQIPEAHSSDFPFLRERHPRLKRQLFRMNGKILWKGPYFVFQGFGWKRQRNMSNSVPFLPTLHITLTSRFTLRPQVSSGASQTTVIYPVIRKLPGADEWHLQYLRTSQDPIASLQVPLAGILFISPPTSTPFL